MPCGSGIAPTTELGICMAILMGTSLDLPASLSMDVEVDTHDFRPWHFDEIRACMAERMKQRTAMGQPQAESLRKENWLWPNLNTPLPMLQKL
jgi:hypothetical protein